MQNLHVPLEIQNRGPYCTLDVRRVHPSLLALVGTLVVAVSFRRSYPVDELSSEERDGKCEPEGWDGMSWLAGLTKVQRDVRQRRRA